MDFVIRLPHFKDRYDSIWVIVDRLTKSAHFLTVKATYSGAKFAKLYIKHIICLFPLYLIEVMCLPLDFGRSCKKQWVPGLILVLFFILRLMVNLRG